MKRFRSGVLAVACAAGLTASPSLGTDPKAKVPAQEDPQGNPRVVTLKNPNAFDGAEFCRHLKQLSKSAGKGFAPLRGKPRTSEDPLLESWETNFKLGGFTRCVVNRGDSVGNTYECFLNADRDQITRRFNHVAAALSACFNWDWQQSRGNWGVQTFFGNDDGVRITVALLQDYEVNAVTVTLEQL